MAFRKLYIGGRRAPDGFIHIRLDKDNLEAILRLPYKNCSIAEVIVDKTLEYVPMQDLINALTEWRRVLSVGGKFTIIYSDVVRAAILYQRSVISFEQLQNALGQQFQTVLSKNKLESLLILRYPEVSEELAFSFKPKKLWEVVLTATKGKLD